MLVRPQPTRLCYTNNAIKRRVQKEVICLQTDQNKFKVFFDVIVRRTWLSNISFLTGLEKMETLNRERIYTFTSKRRFAQTIFSTQSSADYCRKNSSRIYHYFRIELFEKKQ